MKYIVLIIDGASDHPVRKAGNMTPLEYAKTPNLDLLASKGEVGLTMNVPNDMEPSSAIACMSLIGYDPKIYYAGRAPIEAEAMGIELKHSDVAFRCNFVHIENDIMKSYCAGQISSSEAMELIAALNNAAIDPRIKFYPGVSYRHIAVIQNGLQLLSAVCTPPHDISDQSIIKYRPYGDGSGYLNNIMSKSEDILASHPVNKWRREKALAPASSIWLFWGGGVSKPIPSFLDKYGKSAALSSGVDLLRGIAKQTGMTVLHIDGVSGGLDNDYAAQIRGSVDALKSHDMVFIHVESPDESGHMGLFNEKVNAIEKIDSLMVSEIFKYSEKNEAFRVLVLPDHPTPVELKTHTAEPVPYLMFGNGISSTGISSYSEKMAKNSSIYINEGHLLMSRFMIH